MADLMKSQNTWSSAVTNAFSAHQESSNFSPYLKTRPMIVWPQCVRKGSHLQPNKVIDLAAVCFSVNRVIDFPDTVGLPKEKGTQEKSHVV